MKVPSVCDDSPAPSTTSAWTAQSELGKATVALWPHTGRLKVAPSRQTCCGGVRLTVKPCAHVKNLSKHHCGQSMWQSSNDELLGSGDNNYNSDTISQNMIISLVPPILA